MMYSTQNYGVLGLFPSHGVLESRNTTFRKLDLFPSSGEKEEKAPTQFDTLGGVNLNQVVEITWW
jgi:hypothetical protein